MDNVILPIPNGNSFRLNTTIMVRIPTLQGEKTVTKFRKFKYDTGAQFTCLNARELDIDISEEDFKNSHHGRIVEGVGIDKESKIIYYLLQVDNFVVAGIRLGSVPIYITFNPRAQKRLLGFDMIRLFNTMFDFDTKQIQLSKTAQFIEFKKRKFKLEVKDMFEMGIYSKNDSKSDMDMESAIDEEI
ncbi:MAG: hypothetical protein K2M91_07360 [Lachnospiraceae bacterium]|nr:hypothetical protein [Lachnospiraceae bacterium]